MEIIGVLLINNSIEKIKFCITTLEYNIDLSRLTLTAFETNNKINEKINKRKRDDLNIQVLNTIFSKYLALPMATFPSIFIININVLVID